jgi:hypothetical protein
MLLNFYKGDWLANIFWCAYFSFINFKIDEFSSNWRLNVSDANFFFSPKSGIKDRLFLFSNTASRLSHPISLINFMHLWF